MADRAVKEWEFERDGHTFYAQYFSSDIVEVTSPTVPGKKATQAGGSGPEIIANLLAGELISEGANSS